jgi:prepilin-type N-terminal cleavage/methylation domain-containing protein
MNKNSKGFTLIELAIAITIIGILLAMVFLKGGSVIGNANTASTITLIKDLNESINDFKNRYHYLPGDLPLALNDIPNISTTCNIAIATAKIGNGRIDTSIETACVAEQLVKAGLTKGRTDGLFTQSNGSDTPDVFLTARRTTGSNPPTFSISVQNEIEITNLPCDTAQGIDLKMDDGNFATGKIQASVATCATGATNDPVPIIDIAF